jgi:hypothetical protein
MKDTGDSGGRGIEVKQAEEGLRDTCREGYKGSGIQWQTRNSRSSDKGTAGEKVG